MATNYPTSLDTLTNPVSNDSLNSPSHSAQHANANDAIEAIEAKLGVGEADKVGLFHIVTANLSGSSVNIANCFSASYNTYKIELCGVTFSAGGALEVFLRTGSTNATANYATERLSASSTSITADRNATTATWNFNKDAVDNANGTITIYNPFLAIATFMHGEMNSSSSTTVFHHQASGLHSFATSFESLALAAGGANFTAGVAKVYGVKY